jgi:signal transduction histidine kinase/PleD family two-component response regulator
MPPLHDERVLVLPPTDADARLTTAILQEAGLGYQICSDLRDLSQALADDAGAILLTEEVLHDADAHVLVQALEAQPPWSDIPTLLLFGNGADSGAVNAAMELLGNVTILERPVRVTTLVSALRMAIRARRRQYDMRNRLVQIKRAEEQVKGLNDELCLDLARMMRLHQVSTRFVQTNDLVTLLNEILDAAMEITRADMGNIQLLEGTKLKIVAQRGFDERFVEFFNTLQDGDNACDIALRAGKRVILDDVGADTRLGASASREALLQAGVAAVQSTPLLSRSGEVVGVFSTHYHRCYQPHESDLRLMDLLARQAADFIERVKDEEALKEADRRKDEFLATLAHELRNPLAPIRNALQIMRLARNDGAVVEEARSMMERQLGQMVRLIDDLLDVSRITRGKLGLRKEHIELGSIINNAVDSARPLIEEAGHELTMSLPPQPIFLEADPVRLAQVFSNLLNNAAKYMDRGGHIWLAIERNGNKVAVKVRDSGIGIPAKALPTIFDMFSQVDGSLERARGGLGIGLTLVKSLVELHGGTVESHSDGIGRGSEFIVHLPVEAPSTQSAHSSDHDGRNGNHVSFRILIADDNQDAAQSTGMMLRMLGNEVRTVHNGVQAIQEAAAFRPDIILLDIGMPQVNGYEAARRIRQQRWGKQMILVALTGWGQEQDKQRAIAAGFDRHFTKPVDPADLEQLLANLSAYSTAQEHL